MFSGQLEINVSFFKELIIQCILANTMAYSTINLIAIDINFVNLDADQHVKRIVLSGPANGSIILIVEGSKSSESLFAEPS